MGLLKYSFPKKERLSSRKQIEELFTRGSSFYLPAFQVKYLHSDQECSYHQILVSVSKKKFKRAVDRNLVKRRIREAYRLNKYLIADQKPLYLGFVYISTSILTFHEIQDQLIEGLKRLQRSNAD